MGKRIEDPDSWDGHEVETLLACDGTKELVAVTTVKAEGKPEAFYRVKKAGQKNAADFESWLEAVDYYNCIEEDWKTAIAQHKQPIPAGAKVKITGE